MGSLAKGQNDTARLRRVHAQNIHDLWVALALIREAVEDCAPTGSVANSEYLLPEPGYEAEALVRGIYAIAEGHHERPRRLPRQGIRGSRNSGSVAR